jgi:hypothetical protein
MISKSPRDPLKFTACAQQRNVIIAKREKGEEEVRESQRVGLMG